MMSAELASWQSNNRYRREDDVVYGVYQGCGFAVSEEDGGKLFIFMLSARDDRAFDDFEKALMSADMELAGGQVGDVEGYLAVFFDESQGQLAPTAMDKILAFTAAEARPCGFRVPNTCVKCGARATKRSFVDNMVQPLCADCSARNKLDHKNSTASSSAPSVVSPAAPINSTQAPQNYDNYQQQPNNDYYGDGSNYMSPGQSSQEDNYAQQYAPLTPDSSKYDDSYDEYAGMTPQYPPQYNNNYNNGYNENNNDNGGYSTYNDGSDGGYSTYNDGNSGGYNNYNDGSDGGYSTYNDGSDGGYSTYNDGNSGDYNNYNDGNNGDYNNYNDGNNGDYNNYNNNNNGGNDDDMDGYSLPTGITSPRASFDNGAEDDYSAIMGNDDDYQKPDEEIEGKMGMGILGAVAGSIVGVVPYLIVTLAASFPMGALCFPAGMLAIVFYTMFGGRKLKGLGMGIGIGSGSVISMITVFFAMVFSYMDKSTGFSSALSYLFSNQAMVFVFNLLFAILSVVFGAMLMIGVMDKYVYSDKK